MTRTATPLRSFIRNGIQRLFGELQLAAVTRKQLAILLDESILWLDKDTYEIREGQRVEWSQDRQAADKPIFREISCILVSQTSETYSGIKPYSTRSAVDNPLRRSLFTWTRLPSCTVSAISSSISDSRRGCGRVAPKPIDYQKRERERERERIRTTGR